ncbi:MAG: calcium-binding protein [Microvirga sp.]|nr:calcium-binding protein [Microvirga sp.]
MNTIVSAAIALALIIVSGPAHAFTCKAAKSCAEAVEEWCGGYYGADRDDDGIPCENVCRSLAQVAKLKKQIEACADAMENAAMDEDSAGNAPQK